MTHASIWAALDRLAELHGLTPSGLARKAGLDPTSFNKSKRITQGREHWPSTETIARVLDCTGENFAGFALLVCMPSHKPAVRKGE